MLYNDCMEYSSLNPIQRNRLTLNLTPIFVGQLILVESLQNPAFHFKDGYFNLILNEGEGITPYFVSEFAKNYSSEIFIFQEDYSAISRVLKEELTKLTRSLSIGDVGKNAIKHANLLSMQMDKLYNDPFNDELLTDQYQSSKNLGNLLINNKSIHKSVFDSISKSNYHYTITQPLLSSVLLLSFVQTLKIFDEKEIEGMFLTSYFKDIGMGTIPREKYEETNLSEFDRDIFSKHADNSMDILEGRIPLSKSQLSIIKNHHYLNYKIQALVNKESKESIENNEEYLTGIESVFISAIDMLIAMTHKRPYRKPVSPFKALDLLKKVISDEYPQEFKALVVFLKNFLSK